MTKLDFLREIVTQPHEDTPRLVYADWLDENGEPDRAEFIRVQIERHNGPDGISKAIYIDDEKERQAWCDKVQALSRRERELLKIRWTPHFRWLFPDPYGIEVGGLEMRWKGIDCVPSRGFLSSITCSWEDFQAHADKLIWWECAMLCPKCGGGKSLLLEVALPGYGLHSEKKKQIPMPCKTCGGEAVIEGGRVAVKDGSGRIPRPCPETVQPIVTANLNTMPDIPLAEIHKLYPPIETWNFPPGLNVTFPGGT